MYSALTWKSSNSEKQLEPTPWTLVFLQTLLINSQTFVSRTCIPLFQLDIQREFDSNLQHIGPRNPSPSLQKRSFVAHLWIFSKMHIFAQHLSSVSFRTCIFIQVSSMKHVGPGVWWSYRLCYSAPNVGFICSIPLAGVLQQSYHIVHDLYLLGRFVRSLCRLWRLAVQTTDFEAYETLKVHQWVEAKIDSRKCLTLWVSVTKEYYFGRVSRSLTILMFSWFSMDWRVKTFTAVDTSYDDNWS